MTVLDDGVQQLLEDLVRLLVSSHTADGHDEGVAWMREKGQQGSVPPWQTPDWEVLNGI